LEITGGQCSSPAGPVVNKGEKMKNKIVIITGANSGIGRAAAIKFAREGYRVVMACRNLEKSTKVQKEIILLTRNRNVGLLQVDVSSFKSIKSFCSEFKTKYNKLDILIHNAGYFRHGEQTYQLSPDHIELSFAVNALGPFLMSQLLTDWLRKSEDARILNACTTNIRYFFEPRRTIDFDNLQGEFKESRSYNSYKMYGDSKMALLLLTFKMAEKYINCGIKVNAVQIPAIKMSKATAANFKSGWKIAAMVQNLFSSSPETMADTYFHLGTSSEFKFVTGKLINDKRKIMQPSYYTNGLMQEIRQFRDQGVYPRYADDNDNIEKMWQWAVQLTESTL
jgi:NAD(P)-dependent dehydrogenase (short-subunit alcohol dehydrogenase family)